MSSNVYVLRVVIGLGGLSEGLGVPPTEKVDEDCHRWLKREMTLVELSDLVGITVANLSILKNDRARAIRFSTLTGICDALDVQPGDLFSVDPP